MERKHSLWIFVGLGFGAVFGMFLGEAIGNMILGIGIVALAGTFLGWFVAVYLQEQSKKQGKGNP